MDGYNNNIVLINVNVLFILIINTYKYIMSKLAILYQNILII